MTDISSELAHLRKDLAECEKKVSGIKEEYGNLSKDKNDAQQAANDYGKKMKALSETTRVPIAEAQVLRCKIQSLEEQVEMVTFPEGSAPA